MEIFAFLMLLLAPGVALLSIIVPLWMIYGRRVKAFLRQAERPKGEAQELFLEMLSDLADDEEGWEFSGYDLWPLIATHTDTGVIVEVCVPAAGGVGHPPVYITIPGVPKEGYKCRKIRYIAKRIIRIKSKIDKGKSLRDERDRNLKNLAAMNEAYKRMMAKHMHSEKAH